MRKIVIDNRQINTLASSQAALRKFPFLAMSIESQGCCGGKRPGRYPNYDGIRHAIAIMPDDLLQQFKAFLGADELQVWHTEGRKTVKKVR